MIIYPIPAYDQLTEMIQIKPDYLGTFAIVKNFWKLLIDKYLDLM